MFHVEFDTSYPPQALVKTELKVIEADGKISWVIAGHFHKRVPNSTACNRHFLASAEIANIPPARDYLNKWYSAVLVHVGRMVNGSDAYFKATHTEIADDGTWTKTSTWDYLASKDE